MAGIVTAARDLLPFLGSAPAANTWWNALIFGLQYDWFEVTAFVAAVLVDVHVAKQLLLMTEHARHHDNDLEPLAWVRYVIYSFALVQGTELAEDVQPETTAVNYLAVGAFFASYASLVYYDVAIASLPERPDVIMVVFLHLIVAFSLTYAACAAFLPVVVGPIVYLSTLKRAFEAL